jgi:hypothetical protein
MRSTVRLSLKEQAMQSSRHSTHYSLIAAGKVVFYAALATPIVLLAAAGAGVLLPTVGADAMVPASGAMLALAAALGLMGQGVLKLIRRAEHKAFMESHGLTPGCMALTPEELAEGDKQGTPLGPTVQG